MPVNSTIQHLILNPSTPYDRLALRCNLSVSIASNQLVQGGSVSLHGTRYRKPAPGEFEIFGMVGHGEIGATINVGDNTEGDTMMLALANIARENVNVTGDCDISLVFSWRPVQGDLVGMVSETITPVGENPISDSCGNVNERMVNDPIFAAHYAGILQAIGTWIAIKGW